jgi:hypothetical protein
MKLTLHGPNNTPGIFAMLHEPPGRMYIENTDNLYKAFAYWRTATNTYCGENGRPTADWPFLKGTDRYDWRFVVISTMFGATGEETGRMAEAAKARIRAQAPDRLLVKGGGVVTPIKTRRPTYTKIMDDGIQLDYGEAAARLGTTRDALRFRIAKARAKGNRTGIMQLSELRGTDQRGPKAQEIEGPDGQPTTLRKLAEDYGMYYHTLYNRYKAGARGQELIEPVQRLNPKTAEHAR